MAKSLALFEQDHADPFPPPQIKAEKSGLATRDYPNSNSAGVYIAKR